MLSFYMLSFYTLSFYMLSFYNVSYAWNQQKQQNMLPILLFSAVEKFYLLLFADIGLSTWLIYLYSHVMWYLFIIAIK